MDPKLIAISKYNVYYIKFPIICNIYVYNIIHSPESITVIRTKWVHACINYIVNKNNIEKSRVSYSELRFRETYIR